MADFISPKGTPEGALIARIHQAASRAGWTVRIEGAKVWFGDGVARTDFLLADLADDFEEVFLLVGARLHETRARIRPISAREQTFVYGAPWHEYDLSGRHISEKSG